MITPCRRQGTEPGLRPAFTLFAVTPERRNQLVTFLQELGVDPCAPGGPGDSAEALAPIEEALSHTSAGLARNHERLEFLGDAVLRLAAAAFLQREHGGLSVGRHAALRAQLVSDRWLAELGERCGIEAVWQIGPMAAGDRAGRATVRAELCEALIGALYETWGGERGGLAPVRQWLSPHWQRSTAELLADPDQHNWKSALQEWSQARQLGLPHYRSEERSRAHGDPRRFHCRVSVTGAASAEGWGGSRRAAEQNAARAALEQLRRAPAD
jgi:ribonuclease-3